VCLIKPTALSFALFVATRYSLSKGFCSQFLTNIDRVYYTKWPKKESHYQMIKKSNQIVLKPVNKIRFICHFKVWIMHYNIIRWY